MYGRDWQIAIWDTTHFLKAMRTTLTLNQIVDDWIAGCDRLPATKTDYKRKIRLWFKWLSSEGIDPREPTREHILRFKHALQQQGKSPYTYFTYVAVIKIFYRYCAMMHYYEDIGKGLQSSIRMHEHCKHPLSVAEAQRLMNSIETKTIVGKRDKLIIALMLLNGLRSCEVSRINIGDVERVEDRVLLHIQRKGHLDKRDVVALPEMTVELYEDYISERDFLQDDPLIVNHCVGRPSTRLLNTTISQIVKMRLCIIGINDPKITAHSLRHTCGSLLVEMGTDIEIIKDLLGHSDSSTTRIYVDMAQKRRLLRENPSRQIEALLAKK